MAGSIADIPMSSIATAGTFDGVHRGHRFLLGQLRSLASRRGLQPLALILHPHPLQVIRPLSAPKLLSSAGERMEAIAACGVTPVPVAFDSDLARLTCGEFIGKIHDEMGVKSVLLGHDNHFGSDCPRTLGEYRLAASPYGVDVGMADPLPGVNSSQIRTALSQGNARHAAEMLGHPYSLKGTVVHGKRIGHTLGYPTANIGVADTDRLIPKPGVYATWFKIPKNDGETGIILPSVTNIGHRPTVDLPGAPLSIETHIPGFDGTLYGDRVEIQFVERIRDEIHFPDKASLSARLALDTETALKLLTWK